MPAKGISSGSRDLRMPSSARRSPTPRSGMPLAFVDIDPPTISMGICINDSPLAGREGKLLTARQVRERLVRETRTNVGIQFADTDIGGPFRDQCARRNANRDPRRANAARRVRDPRLPAGGDLPPGRSRGTCWSRWNRSMWMCRRRTSATSCNRSRGARRTSCNMEHQPHSVTIAGRRSRPAVSSDSKPTSSTPPRATASCRICSRNTAPFKGEIPTRNNGVLISMEGGVCDRLRAGFHPGARTPLHRAEEEIYEGMIVGENSRAGRYAGQSMQGEKADQHAVHGRRQGHPLAPPHQDDPGTRPRIHRARTSTSKRRRNRLRMRKKIFDATARKRSGIGWPE